MQKLDIVRAALGGLLALGVAGRAPAHDASAPPGLQKCYGVAKAGQNDCGTAKHTCAGLARIDSAPEEWKFVTKGSCRRLGGLTRPPRTS